MKVKLANRMNAFQESIFSELTQMKKAEISAGNAVIDLSIGSPDLPPPTFISEVVSKYANNPEMYGYSLTGTYEFLEAVSTFYARNYAVSLDSKHEVSQLMGSQDGLVHIPMVFCNPGDYILVPDPGYTAYATGAAMAGANLYPLPLKKENQFLPDLKEIPKDVLDKTSMLILNFPGNPVPALATKEFFEEAIRFANKHNIIILHDFAYSELYFDEKPISFLSIEGSKEVGIELNSLSKSFSMAGCRVAYAIGNREMIHAINQFKSNIDYGVFFPIQSAATNALLDESNFLSENRKIYRKRRDILVNGLNEIGWRVASPKASMFVWAEIPPSYQSSKQFAIDLIQKAKVVVTPGVAFGKWGEGYVRMALVQPEEQLLQTIKQIEKSGILKKSSLIK
ncbi:LL-diaminopimelate aminotransferase [Bacillus massilinigeriensis]|uniref:LL-diaminopimelate aminotransferase n=1 Tax=Bacillus massilionigeriensis TaxID=1805475 RepID=UPI00096B10F6|nr:LL-diaminopimelate aminotransferase [Bacillus massilionigeriensis]